MLRVLLCTDLMRPELAEALLERAVGLLEGLPLVLDAMYVFDDLVPYLRDPRLVQQWNRGQRQREHQRRADLRGLVAKAPDWVTPGEVHLTAASDAAAALLERSDAYDLLVVGHHPASATRLFASTVPQRLVRRSMTPLLLVPFGGDPGRPS